jgi:hypothetical protein
MKPRLYISIKRFWINLGWFSGEEFVLFSFKLFECFTNSKGNLDQITFFDLQIAKFSLCFGLHLL